MKKYKLISILDTFSLVTLFGFSSKKDKVFKKMINDKIHIDYYPYGQLFGLQSY